MTRARRRQARRARVDPSRPRADSTAQLDPSRHCALFVARPSRLRRQLTIPPRLTRQGALAAQRRLLRARRLFPLRQFPVERDRLSVRDSRSAAARSSRAACTSASGPEQNFTYIVALQPKIAIIFDIRRGNMIEHLMYKALFETVGRPRATFCRSCSRGRGRPDSTRLVDRQQLFDAFVAVDARLDALPAESRGDQGAPHEGARLRDERQRQQVCSSTSTRVLRRRPADQLQLSRTAAAAAACGRGNMPTYAIAPDCDRLRGEELGVPRHRSELSLAQGFRVEEPARAGRRRLRRAQGDPCRRRSISRSHHAVVARSIRRTSSSICFSKATSGAATTRTSRRCRSTRPARSSARSAAASADTAAPSRRRRSRCCSADGCRRSLSMQDLLKAFNEGKIMRIRRRHRACRDDQLSGWCRWTSSQHPDSHRRRRARRQRGRVAARRARPRRRRSTRCAACAERRRTRPTASPSSSARTRSRAPRRRTRTACSRPRCACSARVVLRAADEARVPGGTRARRRSRRLLARRCTSASRRIRASTSCAKRSRRCRARASSPPVRSRPTRSPRRFARGSASSRSRSTTRSRRSSRATRSTTSIVFRASRYGKETMDGAGDEGAYLNCPFTREQYEAFIDALIAADQHHGHEFDEVPYFEGCMPVEEMARRGRETLRFGPMKPVGLRDPRTGREAVRRRAASHGGSRRPHVEPRRLPDAAAHSGAAARVPDDPRARRTPSSCASDRSTGTRTSTRRRRSRRTSRCATTRMTLFAGQLTGVEGYTESTRDRTPRRDQPRRACSRGDAPVCRRPRRCSARCTAICARPTRSTSSR